jgi:hypothetical protein
MSSSAKDIIWFADGRDSLYGLWETDGPNAPVFIDEFVACDGVPFAISEGDDVFRMRSSKDTVWSYTLDPNLEIRTSAVLKKGAPVSEDEAVKLL